jgi:magnesium-transporting ATPase (P-type)
MVALVITIVLAVTGYADWLEGVGIAAAVFLATFVSTYSEHKNETSFQKLQEEASQVKNNVFRNGKVTSILVGEVVKGDYVLLQAGDKVPADGHLVEGNIHCAQAALTGEPYPVVKHANPTYTPPSEINFSDKFVAFRESVVVDGEAVLIVDSVGTETQYGAFCLVHPPLNNDFIADTVSS